MRRRIEKAQSIEEIMEIIADEIYNIKITIDDTFTLKSKDKNNNLIRATFANITKKIYYRNSRVSGDNKYCECDFEDVQQESFLLICDFLRLVYNGKIKLNDIVLTQTDSLEVVKECFNSRNIKQFMRIMYNTVINKDFKDNTLTNKYNQFNIVHRDNQGKYQWVNLEVNASFNQTIELPNGESIEAEDGFYKKTSDLYKSEEELNYNSSSICGILARNMDILTKKQRQFIEHQMKVMDDPELELWKGDENYSKDLKKEYKKYIQKKYFNAIQNGEIPSLETYSKDKKIYVKQIYNDELNTFLNKLFSYNNRDYESKFNFLNNQLQKNSRLTDSIVDLMLDKDIYKYYMQVLNGNMSKYKFCLVYLKELNR